MLEGVLDLDRQKDLEARRVAQTVFDRSIVLEAGAGTGKTAALVARIVAWAVGPGWDRAVAGFDGAEANDEGVAGSVLDGIVAITFTEDAAAEMTRRVAQALDEIKRDVRLVADNEWPDEAQVITGLERGSLPADLDQVRTRAGALLTVLERLRTSTIHAFARNLIARYPVEAGVHPAFEVDADGVATADCVEWVVEELLAGAYRGEVPARTSHQLSTAVGDAQHPAAFSHLGVLNVRSSTPPRPSDRNPLWAQHLAGLATKPGEKCGLCDDALLLAGRGIGPVEIRTSVTALVAEGVPAEALAEDPLAPARLAPLVSRLFDSLDAFEPSVQKLARPGSGAPRTIAAAEWILDMPGREREGMDLAPGDILIGFGKAIRADVDWKKNLGKLKAWGRRFKLNQAEKEVFDPMSAAGFEAIARLVASIDYALSFDPEVFGAIRRLLHEILTRVEIEKRRRGIVVFHDLLVGARRLLENHPAVRQTLRNETTQLLVDEMQDTDREQAKIVGLLGLADEAGEGPGLFLVGDPKQSIYGWRNADMAVYRRLVRDLEAQGGEVCPLVVNFRSLQPVLDEVTRLVEPEMDEDEEVQPPFVGLLTGRADDVSSDGGAQRAAVEHWVSAEAGPAGAPAKTSASAAAELEAEAVARDAAALWDGTTSMAILMRSRSHQAAYLEALRRHGVPYVVGKDPNYYRTREVTEMMALVRLILDPFDFVALVAVMRSPMVGVPDAALRPLWKAGLPGRTMKLGIEEGPKDIRTLIEAAALEVKALDLGEVSLEALAGWPEALQGFLKKLSIVRRSFEADPPDVFLEKLRLLLVPEPLAASRFPGAYRLANIDRFFRELEEVLAEGTTADTVLRHLRRAEREKPDESSGRPRSDAEGVRVLTIHGAKGLGFDHVWLVQTHAGDGSGSRGEPTAAQWNRGFWEMTLQGRRSPGYLEVEAQRTRVEAAEKVRLLYVALTRAKNRLVTVGNWMPTSGTGPMLKSFENRAGGWPMTEDLWPDETPGPREDRDEARWVWLGHPLWDAQTPKAQAMGPERTVVDPARIEADAEHLDRWMEHAQEHQARPWLGTASEEAHRLFREAVADRFGAAEDEPNAPRETGIGQRVAMAVGTAMHGLLERFDHGAKDPMDELNTRLGEALVWLEGALPREELRATARGRLERLVERLWQGPLWQRFLALDGSILARELPLVTSPDGETAVGAVTGSIDLVYRDLSTGEIVIADYKTDHLANDAEIQNRAVVYQPQLEIYARALQKAMNLDVMPRQELWFVGSGVVHGFREGPL